MRRFVARSPILAEQIEIQLTRACAAVDASRVQSGTRRPFDGVCGLMAYERQSAGTLFQAPGVTQGAIVTTASAELPTTAATALGLVCSGISRMVFRSK